MGSPRPADRSGGRLLATVVALSLAAPGLGAQTTAPPATTVQGNGSFVPRGLAVSGMAVVGSAWKADNTPIPHAKVRLRSVVTGRIEGATEADDAGQFVFEKVSSGSYLVELVNDSGKVLAVSHPFTVGSGETIATFVRLGAGAAWYEGFFGSAALAVAAAAAAAGVTAVAPEQVRPVSGRQ